MTMSEMNSQSFLEIKQHFDQTNTVYFDSATQNLVPKFIKDQYFNADKDINWARDVVRSFISAERSKEIVFTWGNSYSVALIISGLKKTWRPNDTIVIPESEHAVNYQPWKKFAEECDCNFETVNIIKDGRLDLGHLEEILENCSGKVLFSTSHVSAVTGYLQPLEEIFSLIKEYDGITVLDATHSISHEHIDVCRDLVDFMFFHSANTYNYSGVGVLYAKQRLLEKIEPVLIDSLEVFSYPEKLESKYLNNNGVIALARSLQWLDTLGMDNIKSHYLLVNANLQMMLNELDFVDIFHPNSYKGGVISFNIRGQHCLDVKDQLVSLGVEISAGALDSAFVANDGVARISWGIHTSKDDVAKLEAALKTFDK